MLLESVAILFPVINLFLLFWAFYKLRRITKLTGIAYRRSEAAHIAFRYFERYLLIYCFGVIFCVLTVRLNLDKQYFVDYMLSTIGLSLGLLYMLVSKVAVLFKPPE